MKRWPPFGVNCAASRCGRRHVNHDLSYLRRVVIIVSDSIKIITIHSFADPILL
jgi:hypothetical protein